jgi:hypothetical protein
MLLHDVFRGGRLSSSGLENSLVSMDRDFADAMLHLALWRDPVRVSGVIADVTCQLKAEGYSAGGIAAAIDELLAELEGSGQTRH